MDVIDAKPLESVFVGLAYDEWTNGVQQRFMRDLLDMMDWCYTNAKRLVIVCIKDDPNYVIDVCGVLRLTDQSLAKYWLAYEVYSFPTDMIPPGLDHEKINIIQVPPVEVAEPNVNLDPVSNPGLAKEQGRPSTGFNLLDRPAPNPYTPITPVSLSTIVWGF